jgi:hypothetical protein
VVAFAVRIVREFSWKFIVDTPVVVLREPLTGDENVFVTQTERPPFAIGSGVPNGHPVFVQSVPAGGTPASVAPTVQLAPTHESANRLVAPAGVALSGTCDLPPPSERLPQVRFFSGMVPARSRNVCPQVPVPVVDWKSKPLGPLPVVEVVEVEVDVVVVLDVDVLELDVLVEELVDVDELVLDEVLDDDGLVEVDVEVLVVLEVEVLVELEVDVLVVDVLVLVDDEVLVDDVLVDVVVDVDVLEVDVLVELDVELLVVVEEEVELELVDVLVVEEVDVDDVDVEVVLDVLVLVEVVVAFGLQTAGSGDTMPGTATASMQSVLNVVTQSTQSTMSCASRMAPPQLEASNVVAEGQLPTKPMSPGVMSAAPPQTLSAPPHALQMVETFFVSALAISSVALPSPGSGHGFEWIPFRRASWHFWSAFERANRNLPVPLPIASWHLLTALPVPNSLGWKAP